VHGHVADRSELERVSAAAGLHTRIIVHGPHSFWWDRANRESEVSGARYRSREPASDAYRCGRGAARLRLDSWLRAGAARRSGHSDFVPEPGLLEDEPADRSHRAVGTSGALLLRRCVYRMGTGKPDHRDRIDVPLPGRGLLHALAEP